MPKDVFGRWWGKEVGPGQDSNRRSNVHPAVMCVVVTRNANTKMGRVRGDTECGACELNPQHGADGPGAAHWAQGLVLRQRGLRRER